MNDKSAVVNMKDGQLTKSKLAFFILRQCSIFTG